ncbi:helix-turn-helix domain-containing protein [Streptomyces sp. NBC_00249]|uniref:helix-turn-helix domain-containing protein n=1 Tax=Streptomyces sp. NBC_00249 TaxID=2975690 RepID=UPI0022552B15|nr:helix-turn-helix transcriptional regulator [Streptomyces sp. NBC_00249]MCX5199311.1 helix-turn-helix domain-containing protein [Streptomyces sp. NBC_00249]
MATRPSTGTIAGFVLRTARESVPLTQAGMAEALGVDLATMQGWESGRRPIANMRAVDLLRLRRRLAGLGADAAIVALLDAAMDADRIIAATLQPGEGPHPLAEWVHTRDTAHMLAWALTGTRPPSLAGIPSPRRRGPAAASPLLPAPDRSAFFERLRTTAEAAPRTDAQGVLLHRQALYLTSYDKSPEAVAWTAQALHARRGLLARRGWTPQWAEARSTATALARLGDPVPLLDFIERAMVDDDAGEAANLNYWAYWLGGTPLPQSDDMFMRDRQLTGWDPVTLLRGLTYGLHHAPGYVDLYAHTMWALLTAHPWLPQASALLVRDLAERTERLLDGGGISERSRRELTTVNYVLRDRT